jgi:hypothetical protein
MNDMGVMNTLTINMVTYLVVVLYLQTWWLQIFL